MEAYFDNSATTKALDSVRDIMVKTLMEDFGNPSAKHTKGMEAEKYIRQAAADIAKTLKVKDKEILFTSGGTESNNMALIGTALANQRAGKHIISTRIEHASVYQPLAFLESLGFEVTYLHVDHNGHISLEEKGIYVSSGSACSSNHPAISGTLKAIGVKKELLDSTLRFSFGMFNKKEEIDYAVDVLKELLPVLRRFTIK